MISESEDDGSTVGRPTGSYESMSRLSYTDLVRARSKVYGRDLIVFEILQ